MNFPALAVAPLVRRFVGIAGDDPAHLRQITLPREDPSGSMVSAAPAAGVCALHVDLARTAEAELGK